MKANLIGMPVEPQCFKPYTMELQVETEDDHKALYYLFKMTPEDFKEYARIHRSGACDPPSARYVFDDDHAMFDVIDNQHQVQGIDELSPYYQ